MSQNLPDPPKRRGRPPGPRRAEAKQSVAKNRLPRRNIIDIQPLDGTKGYFDAQLRSNKRDLANFPVDEQPGITDRQLLWLAERLSSESDVEACELAHFSRDTINQWKEREPAFLSVYEMVLANKREGFKYLVTQALPKVLRRLLADLDDGNGRTRMSAATLILRTNGMLVDKVQRTDPDAVIRLMEMMRQTAPVQPLLIEPRE